MLLYPNRLMNSIVHLNATQIEKKPTQIWIVNSNTTYILTCRLVFGQYKCNGKKPKQCIFSLSSIKSCRNIEKIYGCHLNQIETHSWFWTLRRPKKKTLKPRRKQAFPKRFIMEAEGSINLFNLFEPQLSR